MDKVLTVTVGGHTLPIVDLTSVEIEHILTTAECGWDVLVTAPLDARHPRLNRVVLTTVARRFVDADEAQRIVDAMTGRDILAAYEWVDEDRPVEFRDGVPVVDPPEVTDGSATT